MTSTDWLTTFDIEVPIKGNNSNAILWGAISLIGLGLILAVIIAILKNNNDNNDDI